MTLAEFLLARIAEDEAVAKSVHEVEPKSAAAVFTSLAAPTGTVEMSPARVLAECEAKRRIVELHSNAGADWNLAYCATCEDRFRHDAAAWPCPTLRALALPFADHPDFQEDWRV